MHKPLSCLEKSRRLFGIAANRRLIRSGRRRRQTPGAGALAQSAPAFAAGRDG
jgi:hypothetical protein